MKNKAKKIENSDGRNDRAVKDRGDVIIRTIFPEKSKNPVPKADYYVNQTAENIKDRFPDRGDTENKESGERKDTTVKKRKKKPEERKHEEKCPKMYNATDRKQLHERYTFRQYNRTSDVLKNYEADKKCAITDIFARNTKYLMQYYEVNTENVKSEAKAETERSKKTGRNELKGNQKDNSDESHTKSVSSQFPATGPKADSAIQSQTLKEHKQRSQKKPVIRTIFAKHKATKLYKAVIFEEPKPCKCLNVNIPVDIPKSSGSTFIDILQPPPAVVPNVTTKPRRRKSSNKSPIASKVNKHRIKSKRVVISPVSPPPEVPMWDPRCLNQHTKPYYEAWVNKQPTAMTLEADKQKILREKQEYILKERKAAKRDWLMSLEDMDVNDERQTGRIKISVRTKKPKVQKLQKHKPSP